MSEKNGLVRIGTGRGTLGALVKRGVTPLSPAQLGTANALVARADQASGAQVERLGAGQLDIEIAPDFSASTTDLHRALTDLAGNLTRRIAAAYPSARLSYGIFGGGDAIAHGGSSSVLDREHVATDGWESNLARYLVLHAARPSSPRQEVLITFHDARPANNDQLAAAIKAVNERGTMVIIAYLPSLGSEGGDKQMLQDLADSSAGGFKNGIFIDLSGVRCGDSAVMEGLLADLIDAVAKAQSESSKLSGGDKAVGGVLAATKLRVLVGPIVDKARLLTSGEPTDSKVEDKS